MPPPVSPFFDFLSFNLWYQSCPLFLFNYILEFDGIIWKGRRRNWRRNRSLRCPGSLHSPRLSKNGWVSDSHGDMDGSFRQSSNEMKHLISFLIHSINPPFYIHSLLYSSSPPFQICSWYDCFFPSRFSHSRWSVCVWGPLFLLPLTARIPLSVDLLPAHSSPWVLSSDTFFLFFSPSPVHPSLSRYSLCPRCSGVKVQWRSVPSDWTFTDHQMEKIWSRWMITGDRRSIWWGKWNGGPAARSGGGGRITRLALPPLSLPYLRWGIENERERETRWQSHCWSTQSTGSAGEQSGNKLKFSFHVIHWKREEEEGKESWTRKTSQIFSFTFFLQPVILPN